MYVKQIANSPLGSIIISIIFGLGLAALFQRACRGDSCIVVKAPSRSDVDRFTYKIDQSCYKYRPELIPCPPKDPRLS